jgi:hypothetical protein
VIIARLLSSPRASGAAQAAGVTHILREEDSLAALCGRRPRGKSLGWASVAHGTPVTCERCNQRSLRTLPIPTLCAGEYYGD